MDQKNSDLLAQTYGIQGGKKRDYFDVALEMLQKGWARIGDLSKARDIGIEVNDINNIPSAVDDVLATFAQTGQSVTVADVNRNWKEVTYPFKSLQSAVRRAMRGALTTEASTSVFDIPLLNGSEATIYKNPTPEQARKLCGEHGLRFLTLSDGTLYMWNAFDVVHKDIMDWLGLDFISGKFDYETGIVTYPPDATKLAEDCAENRGEDTLAYVKIKNKTASTSVFEVEDAKVYQNPTPEQAKVIFERSRGVDDRGNVYEGVRFYSDSKDNLYMWSAYQAEHHDIMKYLGEKDYNRAGFVMSAQKAADLAERWQNDRFEAEEASKPKQMALPLSSHMKRAFTERDLKLESYNLWKEALEAWDAKVSPVEQFIMQNGGIGAYSPNDMGRIEEKEEYRGIPVRLRGNVPYDEMVERLKAEHLLDQEASYGDLYDMISHLPERGPRPQLRDYVDEAKRNLEHEDDEILGKQAGNLSNTYTDNQMEEIYDEQHAEDQPGGDGSGGNVYHDWNQSTNDFPKPEDTERKQKIQLDLLEDGTTPPIASYEVTWYMGTPADDNGSM